MKSQALTNKMQGYFQLCIEDRMGKGVGIPTVKDIDFKIYVYVVRS